MTYKACKVINDNFLLDAKFEPYLMVKGEDGKEEKRVPVTNPMEKGYIYACLFFYDEVDREIKKLYKMINKIIDEIRMDAHIEDASKLLMELSARVRSAIGDDSLDALIKEILSKESRAISLIPTPDELAKLEKIKDAIFTELTENFSAMTLRNSEQEGDKKVFKFTKEYVNSLTERQKKLISPALRLIGLVHQIRLDEFTLTQEWQVKYKPVRLIDKFSTKEEEIKNSLKKMMSAHLGG